MRGRFKGVQAAGPSGNSASRIQFAYPRRFAGVFIPFFAFAVYAATLSRQYSGDSLSFAQAVESGNVELMIRTSHLLIHPLGWAFYRLWRFLGWTGGAQLPLQILNALGGALCVGLVYRISRRFSNSSAVAAIVSLGFAFSGATWVLSTEAEFVTVPLFFSLLVLCLLLAPPPRLMAKPAYGLLLGLGTGTAALFYLNSAFLVPAVIVGLLLKGELPRQVRKKHVFRFLAALVLFAAAAVCLLALFLSHAEVKTDLWKLIGMDHYGDWSLFDLPHGAYAFLRSIALYPGLGINDRTREFLAGAAGGERALFFGYYALFLMAAVLPLILALSRLRRLPAHMDRIAALSVWTVLYAAFAVFWVPGDFSFWIPVLAAWWFLTAYVLADITPKRKHRIAAALFVIILTAVNALFLILPHHWRPQGRSFHASAETALTGLSMSLPSGQNSLRSGFDSDRPS